MLILQNLLVLSVGFFPKYDLSEEDRQSLTFLQNNLELSITGSLEIGLTLLSSSPQAMLSLKQKTFPQKWEAEPTFRASALEIVLIGNMSDFLQDLARIVEKSKVNPHVYILLWPEICDNELEANQSFHRNVAPYLRSLSVHTDLYFVFRIRNEKSNSDFPAIVILEGYTVSNTFIANKFELEGKNLLNWFYVLNKMGRRRNCHQAILRAISVNDSSWENETKYAPRRNGSNTELKFVGGYAVQMLWVIRDMYNLSVTAMEGDWTGITEGENGTSWLGGNGQTVAAGEADISISQQSLNVDYFHHNLFLLHPTNNAGLRLYFIQPEMSQYRDIFLTPFSGDLWITAIGTLILIVITVKFFGYILKHIAEDENEDNNELVESVMVWGVAIIAQQGYHVEPSSLSIRIVFLFGYMTGLLCFIAYSAQIVSTLSVKTVPIHKADDVLNGAFHLYANPNNTPKAVISHILKEHRRSNDSVFMEEGDAIRRIFSTNGAMQALVAEPDIFYTEAAALNCTEQGICDTISSLNLHRVPIKGGMFGRRHAPFLEWFNYAIIRMLERGLNHRFVTSYIRKSWVICLDEKNAFVQPVKVSDIMSAFKILIAGYACSLITLFVEVVVTWKTRRGSGIQDGRFQFVM